MFKGFEQQTAVFITDIYTPFSLDKINSIVCLNINVNKNKETFSLEVQTTSEYMWHSKTFGSATSPDLLLWQENLIVLALTMVSGKPTARTTCTL